MALADDVAPAVDALLLAQADPSGKPESKTDPADAESAPGAKDPLAEGDAAADSVTASPDKSAAPDKSAPAVPDKSVPAATAAQEEPVAQAAPADQISVQGATEVQLHFAEKINRPTLAKLVEDNLSEAKLPAVKFNLTNPQATSQDNHSYSDWKLAIDLQPKDAQVLLDQMQTQLADLPVFPSSSVIGAKVAGDTQYLALEALLASMVMIVLYLWVRFQNIMFGFAAVLALIHDVLVTVGFLALSYWLAPYFGWALVDPFKISLAVVAALLTIVGYSINDTIVIFDRIREIRGKNPDLTEKMINDSVNQTLGRTLLTSGTVLIGTLILYFVGGPGIHPFAYAMLIGLISGTYSTVYIASPATLVVSQLRKAASCGRKPALTWRAAQVAAFWAAC